MTTTVVYGNAADAYIISADGYNDDLDGWSGTYGPARAGTGTSIYGGPYVYGGIGALVGQAYVAGDFTEYDVYETFLAFDTSSVPDTDTISAAILRIRSDGDVSTTDFTIEARLYDWDTAVEAGDWVAGASLSNCTLLAHYATSSGWVGGTGYDFIDDAMAANVNKTGDTHLLLCSSRTTSNTEPGTQEYVGLRTADWTGTTDDPSLTVTHEAGGSIGSPTTVTFIGAPL